MVFDVLSECNVTAESLSLIRLSHGIYHKKARPVVVKGGVFHDMSYFCGASLRG